MLRLNISGSLSPRLGLALTSRLNYRGESSPPPPGGSASYVLMYDENGTKDSFPGLVVDPSTGIGSVIGTASLTAAGLSTPPYLQRLNTSSGGVLFAPVTDGSDAGVSAIGTSPGSFSLLGSTVTFTGGSPPVLGRLSNGTLLALSMTAASDNGDYVAKAFTYSGGSFSQVGNTLTSTYNRDTSFSAGFPTYTSKITGKVVDDHFIVAMLDVSAAANAVSLYAYSFDGTDISLETSFDGSAIGTAAIWEGPDYIALFTDVYAADITFITYTAAGGFVNEFTYTLQDAVGGTDLINNVVVDPVTGYLHVGVSDADYLTFRSLVLSPNFTTNTMDVVANVTGISEEYMYPKDVVDNIAIMPVAGFGTGSEAALFDGSSYTAIGSSQTTYDIFSGVLVKVEG